MPNVHMVHWSVAGLHSKQSSPPLHCAWYSGAAGGGLQLFTDRMVLLQVHGSPVTGRSHLLACAVAQDIACGARFAVSYSIA